MLAEVRQKRGAHPSMIKRQTGMSSGKIIKLRTALRKVRQNTDLHPIMVKQMTGMCTGKTGVCRFRTVTNTQLCCGARGTHQWRNLESTLAPQHTFQCHRLQRHAACTMVKCGQ